MSKISVVIPSFNHCQYLCDTIDSVLNQSFGDFEVLIADDASTDGSIELIKQKASQDSRIKTFFMDSNTGAVNIYNFLFSKASGDFIATLGSDDIWNANKLSCQYEFMINNPNYGASFTFAKVIDENNKEYNGSEKLNELFHTEENNRYDRIKRLVYKGNYLCQSSSLIRKEICQKVGKFNNCYRQLHDYDYFLRLINISDFYVIKEPLVLYRRLQNNNKSISSVNESNIIRHENEAYFILYDFIVNMDDDLFIETFSDKFKLNSAKEHFELICERFFLFKYTLGYQMALKFLMEIMKIEEVLNCFDKRYNIGLQELYKFTGKVYYNSFENSMERKILRKAKNIIKKIVKKQ